MFYRLKTDTPRKVTRWEHGKKKSTCVDPTPFTKERGEEIFQNAREQAKSMPWVEFLDKNMTDGEIAFVHCVWDCMSGSSCFADAFHVIRRGELESYQREYAKV